LRRYRENLYERGEGYLDVLNKAAHKMQMLVNDLLDYSKLVVSEPDDEFPLVDLFEIVQLAKNNCATAIEETGAVINCEPLGTSYGSPEQLVHVFQNLISNAIRYRRADAAPIIHISGTLSDSEYLMRVEDNGMGMKMEYADQIFKLFKRLHGPEIPGTGIGLSICKRVIENHGGHIWVDSIVGKGSIFSFTLSRGMAA
jgi:light-regulated signal transduction histidine kinase (bacteriophytochrome)